MSKLKPVPVAELVAAIAEAHDCSQTEARAILDSIQSAISGLVGPNPT